MFSTSILYCVWLLHNGKKRLCARHRKTVSRTEESTQVGGFLARSSVCIANMGTLRAFTYEFTAPWNLGVRPLMCDNWLTHSREPIYYYYCCCCCMLKQIVKQSGRINAESRVKRSCLHVISRRSFLRVLSACLRCLFSHVSVSGTMTC